MSKNYFPLIVILIIAGIILQHLLSLNRDVLIFYLLVIFSLSILSHQIFPRSIFPTLLIYLCFITTGMTLLSLSENPPDYPFERSKIPGTIVFGSIEDISLKSEDKFTLTVNTDSVTANAEGYKSKLKLLVKVFTDTSAEYDVYDSLSIGQIVKIKGTLFKPKGKWNPFEFDYNQYLRSINIPAILNVYKSEDIQIIDCSINFWGHINFLRRSIDNTIHTIFSPQTAGLLRGLLLAERSEIDYNLRTNFVNTGVIHVLAVSGLHVGFILLIFLFLFGRCNIYVKYIFTILGLIFFLVITGMPVSVVRATLMAVISIISMLSGRKYNLINSILFAALIILIVNPNQLFQAGFQLSFSAVLSIIYVYPVLSKRIVRVIKNKYLRKVILFFAVSFAAQIGTLPFTLFYFHKLSLAALFANLLVIPAIAAILGIGILSLLLYPISGWLASIYAIANEVFTYLLFTFINIVGSTKEAYLKIIQFSTYDSIIYYSGIIIFYIILKSKTALKTKVISSLSLLFLFCGLITLDNVDYIKRGELNIFAINIGQGDAFFLSFPNGENAMIDFGPNTRYFDSGAMITVPLLSNLDVDEIKYAFVSHLDNDHYGGFYSISKKIKIDSVYLPAPLSSSHNRVSFEKYLSWQGIPFKYYHKNIINIGQVTILVLNDTTYREFKSLNRNDNSGLLKITFGEKELLFTGDLGIDAEKIYCTIYGDKLKSELLKVSHHGSITGTSEQWLATVKPKIAIISVGENNKFNHPSPIVLERLKEHSVQIYRTDKRGAIILRTDGRIWKEIDWRNNWTVNYIND